MDKKIMSRPRLRKPEVITSQDRAGVRAWRERMKKAGTVVGPKRAKEIERNKRMWQEELERRAEKAAKTNFFGHEDE